MISYEFMGRKFELNSRGANWEIYGVGWTAPDDELIIPSEYNGKPICGIENFAFKFFKGWHIVIPNTIETIGVNAFSYLSNLKKVDFQEGSHLKLVGEKAFYYTSLQELCIPKSVETIHDYAFSTTHIETLSFENGSKLKAIGYKTFSHSKICSITLNLKNTTIDNRAFSNNDYLETIDLKDSDNLRLGSHIFDNCPNLKKVIPPIYGVKYFDDTFPANIADDIRDSSLFL